MTWKVHAERLANQVTRPTSRWRGPVSAIPRHLLVPRWWGRSGGIWTLKDGGKDEQAWLDSAYRNVSLVTRVGPSHADHATSGDHPGGRPTSSSTLPGLVVSMFQHADITDDVTVLDVGVGSGYGTALLARRLGDGQVTSIDVDPYLVEIAAERLEGIGLRPGIVTCDATGPLPGEYDRIVATVAVRPLPASWLAALRPGGRLVTTIANTMIIIVADRADDGGAAGRVLWDRAGFMGTRSGIDYPARLDELADRARDEVGEEITQGRYPVTDVRESWELQSMLEVTAPGIAHSFDEDADGLRTALMFHQDGSWARAIGLKGEASTVHQGGPRRLWNILEEIRHQWLVDGSLPIYGAKVSIAADGEIHLARGNWQGKIS
ncbi:methyltransferase domain-containing protein [Acrocarpospora sp. B8E8]|uniref:methyltransferase domain-containing protein n=1 Tax=Acrocarpospora sp. B8E8 TaxID=3153572 RepID=UPI00325CD414